jgi:hypothetical protein
MSVSLVVSGNKQADILTNRSKETLVTKTTSRRIRPIELLHVAWNNQVSILCLTKALMFIINHGILARIGSAGEIESLIS